MLGRNKHRTGHCSLPMAACQPGSAAPTIIDMLVLHVSCQLQWPWCAGTGLCSRTWGSQSLAIFQTALLSAASERSTAGLSRGCSRAECACSTRRSSKSLLPSEFPVLCSLLWSDPAGTSALLQSALLCASSACEAGQLLPANAHSQWLMALAVQVLRGLPGWLRGGL